MINTIGEFEKHTNGIISVIKMVLQRLSQLVIKN